VPACQDRQYDAKPRPAETVANDSNHSVAETGFRAQGLETLRWKGGRAVEGSGLEIRPRPSCYVPPCPS
jgi:hypothetical protein